MAINVGVPDNGGLLPDVILLIQWCYQEVFKENQNAPRPSEHLPVRGEKMSKRFDIFFPLTGRRSEGLDAFRFFFKHSTCQKT